MGGSDHENNIPMVPSRPSNYQGGSGMVGIAKFPPPTSHNHRRALSNINQNLIGATTLHPIVVVNKTGFSEKFAAQLSNHPPLPHEIKKPPTQTAERATNTNGLDDCEIIDVEGYGEDSDASVPMFVKYTEAMMVEIDQMVEVEMEDAMEEPIMDIDCDDRENPLAVGEYIEELYAYYRQTEKSGCVSPNYMVHQFDINTRMRAILIDWLIEVHYKFELNEETLFLTVNLIDRFLEHQIVVRKKLQLVGVTAMLLACKYEEVFVPPVEELVLISDKAYTRKEVLDMEKLMVNALQFNMSVPTPYVFMRRFLKAAQSDNTVELLSFFIIELCLVEYEMLKFPPSLLASAAIYTAQCSIHKHNKWTKTSEWHTKYSEDQLMECSRMMVSYHQKAAGNLTGVYNKYSASKFGDVVAKSEPARFLLNL